MEKPKERKCLICGRVLPISNFDKTFGNWSNYYWTRTNICKNCKAILNNMTKFDLVPVEELPVEDVFHTSNELVNELKAENYAYSIILDNYDKRLRSIQHEIVDLLSNIYYVDGKAKEISFKDEQINKWRELKQQHKLWLESDEYNGRT